MKSESKTVPETVKTVTISIEEYEALQELKAENVLLAAFRQAVPVVFDDLAPG